ncbi:MAG: type II toxin-antitoxin system RelE/ParE family toxin [Treponema sp.]|jgi:plasmid stabilization system protein ParE|nr:type II toxin-antitoxin system RelE/ParE family toxin [Treponema sp.]
MQKFEIKWAAPAREDLHEIIDYIFVRNESYAVKVLDKIEGSVKNLAVSPKRGRIVPELEKYGYLLYREMIVDYWRIIYKIENNIVWIMLVIDGRRNVGDLILKKMMMSESEL